MAEAAVLLGCSRDAARKWLQRQGLAFKVAGRWYVEASDLKRFTFDKRSTRQLARSSGRTVQAERKRLRRHGTGRKLGGRWVADVSRLKAGVDPIFMIRMFSREDFDSCDE